MYILMIAPEQTPLPPITGGSVETCMYQFAQRLARKHRVTIVSRQHPKYPGQSRYGKVTVVRVPAANYLANVASFAKRKRYDWIQIDNRPRFVPTLRKHFPRTPISLFMHSTTFAKPPQVPVRTAARHLSQADLIIGNSRSLRSKLIRLFPQQRSKVKYVLLGADTEQFRPPAPPQRARARARWLLGSDFTVVYAGRLIPRKGLPVLIRALGIVRKSLPNARLIVAGGGRNQRYVEQLRHLAASLKVPVTFAGRIPRDRMHEVYWAADCFVCPSQGHEAFGLVAVEALAAGIPCIAANNGGLREIMGPISRDMLVKRYRDPRAFAETILRIAKNRQLAKRLGRRGRRCVLRYFNWDAAAARLERIWSQSAKEEKSLEPTRAAPVMGSDDRV